MLHPSFAAKLGARLRARREARGYTQAELADKVGVSPNYFGVLERGLKLPTLDTLILIAEALEVSPAELLGDVSEQDPWVDDLLVVSATIPEDRRAIAIAILRTIATHK
jgi:transcriptional regulator with XRE-family HTH domain